MDPFHESALTLHPPLPAALAIRSVHEWIARIRRVVPPRRPRPSQRVDVRRAHTFENFSNACALPHALVRSPRAMSAQFAFATAARAAPVVAKKPTTARRATRARVVTRAARDGPVVIGLAADSGCGKSTFMRRMTSLFGGKATPPEGGNPDSNTLISDTTTVLCLDDYHLNDRQGRKESGLTALNLKEQNFGAWDFVRASRRDATRWRRDSADARASESARERERLTDAVHLCFVFARRFDVRTSQGAQGG